MRPPIMLASATDLDHLQNQRDPRWWESRFVEPKLDGIRLIRYGKQWLSRQGHPLYNIEHITSVIDTINGIDKFLIDGELVSDDWGSTMSQVRSFSKSANQLPGKRVVYRVFDACEAKKPGVPLRFRKESLVDLLSGLDTNKVQAVASSVVSSYSDFHTLYADYLAAGCDGAIIKERSSSYVNGRSTCWLKVKPHYDLDCKIVGFKEGKGKYAHTLGALLVVIPVPGSDTWSENSTAISGMGDKERGYMWKNKKNLIGRICEVKFREITKEDRLKEPRFVRMRHDKEGT